VCRGHLLMPVRDRRVLYPPCTGLRSLPRFPQFVCPPDNGLETRLRPLKLSGALSRSSTGQQTQSDSQLVLTTDHQALATDKSAISSQSLLTFRRFPSGGFY